MRMKRRAAIQAGLSGMAYFSTRATTPDWIVRSASAMSPCLDDGRVLVILQLAGGNDSLNMLIPRTDPVYYDAQTRPNLAVPAGSEINLDGLNGLHPRMPNLADWHQRGMAAFLQNVGYVNPNLSHFTSTDYYEFGFVPGEAQSSAGWAARLYDSACAGVQGTEALFMTAAGTTAVPDAFEGAGGYTPPAIADPANYALAATTDASLRLAAIRALNSISTADPVIDFLQRSENVTEASISDIATAAAQPDLVPAGTYPATTLGGAFKLVSQIIRAGFPTRIFYVSQGGYDTHANQIAPADPLNAGDHPMLLAELDSALHAFLTEMQLSGNLDRVLVMSFSEFGRRVKENGSNGTDHGAAHASFVLGGGVRGGVYGGQPDLLNLVNGNLKHALDFRTVYSRVVESWFGASAAPLFGQAAYDSIIAPELPEASFIRSPIGPLRVNDHLLGKRPDPAGLDLNGDGRVDVADTIQGLANP